MVIVRKMPKRNLLQSEGTKLKIFENITGLQLENGQMSNTLLNVFIMNFSCILVNNGEI